MKPNIVILASSALFCSLYATCQFSTAWAICLIIAWWPSVGFPVWPVLMLTGGIAGIVLILRSRNKAPILFCTLLFVLFVPVNLLSWSSRGTHQASRMDELITVLSEMEQIPPTLDSPELSRLQCGPLGLDRISYEKERNHFVLSAYGVPIGPFSIYSSETSEWTYSE